MTRTFTGGCLCGSVRYVCSGEPVRTYFCHCLDCQKESGSAFIVELSMPRAAVTLTGVVTRYSRLGDSGQSVYRNSCRHCGSMVLTEYDSDPGLVGIRAGGLDDAAWVKPTAHVYWRRKQPWLGLADDLPKHAGDFPPD